MTKYTMFNPDADPNEQNIAWSCSSKSEALRNLPSNGWYIIKGDYFRGKSDMWRENQADAVRFIKRVISGELGGKSYYLDGVEWKCPMSDWEDEELDGDDLTEGMRKMDFNDMVKKQRANNNSLVKSRLNLNSVKKAQIMVDLDWDDDGMPLKTITVDVPSYIEYNGRTYNAQGEAEEGLIYYPIRDNGNRDDRISIGISSIDGGGPVYYDGVQVYAIAPGGEKLNRYSADFTYFKVIPRDQVNSSVIEQAIREAVASLPIV